MQLVPWLDPKVALRPSSIEGSGLFALESIEAGESILRWGGTYLTAAQAFEVGEPAMQWDDDLYSIGNPGDDPSTRINHSCDGNTWMVGATGLEARRRIEAGEEVTVDYVLFLADETYVAHWDCRCGSPSCRGRITGLDYQDLKLQNEYRGHFSPLLNKRVNPTVT